ncbi:hypothetical protein ACHAW6_009973 [Cyclotella cf. meneghiniana]
MLCYWKMPCNLFSDTMFCPEVPSAQGYTMVQIFAVDFGLSQSYPISARAMPMRLLVSILHGKVSHPRWLKTCKGDEIYKEASCYLQNMEPHSVWCNSTKHEIRELKKGAARKLTWPGYVCSHTAYDIYCLGRVPKTLDSRELLTLAHSVTLVFGIGLNSGKKGVTFSDDILVNGKYLGPSTDVGPAMIQHNMKANGEIKDHSMVRSLTPEECELARVLHQKNDQYGNPMSSAHWNPALDNHELAANVITEDIYAQCDANENQYVLPDIILDYHQDPSMSVAQNNQVTVIDGKKIMKCSARGW